MCAAMIGADPEALDQLAASFERQARTLDGTAQRVRSQIHASPWQGGAANRFRTDWDNTHMPRLRQTAGSLRTAASALRREAADQRRASGLPANTGVGHAVGRHGSASDRGARPPSLADLLDFGVNAVIVGGEAFGHITDALKEATGIGLHPWASSALKGIGLGAALADLATALKNDDRSGALLAVADGGFIFAPTPVGWIYSGLKAEIGFFIPLEAEAQQEHFDWMERQGYSPTDVVHRYEGLQGFINLGNDNAERKAPWMNDAADVIMQKPAEWLYRVGIRF